MDRHPSIPDDIPDDGIEPEYIDTWGRKHVPSDETRRLILAALGSEAVAGHPLLAPTLVVRDDTEFIPLRVPAAQTGSSIKLEIRWENGDVEHHPFWLPDLRESAPVEKGGHKLIPLPKQLRLGYHELRIYWVTQPELTVFAEAHFIVCPRRARVFEGRAAGVALSLYGLRSARDWGCGDITDLRAAIDVFARAGAAFVALNPLHAIANREPYNTSPYLPQSSLFRNFLYIDVERTPGYLPEESIAKEAAALRASELVEYERVARLKIRVLSDAFDRFLKSGSAPEFDMFVEAEGAALEDYAVYCALDETMHGRDPNVWLWTQWPEQYRDPGSQAVKEFGKEHRTRVLFFKFLQWQLDAQLAQAQAHALAQGMKIGLYHDLALATDRFGADLWANRAFYVAGCRVGAPPDDFAPNGQDWGFPPPNREAHRANGYKLFAESIRNSARHGGVLRIDHVMRFFRLYWMPDGVSAADGAYVRDYAEDLLGVLALESSRNGFSVVGEDLGTVSGDVRHRLADAGILGIRLLWFERYGDGSFRAPGEYPWYTSVSTTTHDLPTLAGFFAGRDIEARKSAGLIDAAAYQEQWSGRHREIERLNRALEAAGFAGDPLGFVLSTPCALAVINQEDLTGEIDQQNLPASTWQYPNWRRKMKVAIENMAGIEEDLRRRIIDSGRESAGHSSGSGHA
ncbi:MAG TPA: 4-alpha-glucanotransferase [Bryobacteraceae bacterium]